MPSLRAQILALAGRIDLLAEAPNEPIVVQFRRGTVKVQMSFTAAELEPYLLPVGDPVAELTGDDRAILRVLVEAPGPLLGKDIAQALGLRREWSTLRDRLGPRAPLRRLGLVAHEDSEGYAITDAGRAFAERSQ